MHKGEIGTASERQTRYAACVLCNREGEVTNKTYSQDEIHKEDIEYGGSYVFKRICDDCQYTYIHKHKDIKVEWDTESIE